VDVGRKGVAGAQATLPRGVMFTVGYTTLTVADTGYVPPPDFPALGVCGRSPHRTRADVSRSLGITPPDPCDRIPLVVPGVTSLPGRGQVQVQIVSREELPFDWSRNADPWRACLDARVVGKELWLRRRRAGDRFCPLGLGNRHKLVSELLVNEKVPAWWRDRVPLLVREDDEVMWVCGWRLDERAKVTDGTSWVAVIHLHTQSPESSPGSPEPMTDG